MSGNLEFDYQLESDVIALMSGVTAAKYAFSVMPDTVEYPAVIVRCDRAEPQQEFKALGIYTADILIHAETYRDDDRDGAAFRALCAAVRDSLYAAGLLSRLQAVSAYTIYAAENVEGYANPDTQLRGFTFQMQIKFSPVKAE